MMKSEFIERTGFEPTEAEYREIEAEYMGCDIGKDEFCKTWKKQGGVQRLMRLRARRIEELEAELASEKNVYIKMDSQHRDTIRELEEKVAECEGELNHMNAQMGLERHAAAEENRALANRATEAERKLAILKEAFAIITGKETK